MRPLACFLKSYFPAAQPGAGAPSPLPKQPRAPAAAAPGTGHRRSARPCGGNRCPGLQSQVTHKATSPGKSSQRGENTHSAGQAGWVQRPARSAAPRQHLPGASPKAGSAGGRGGADRRALRRVAGGERASAGESTPPLRLQTPWLPGEGGGETRPGGSWEGALGPASASQTRGDRRRRCRHPDSGCPQVLHTAQPMNPQDNEAPPGRVSRSNGQVATPPQPEAVRGAGAGGGEGGWDSAAPRDQGPGTGRSGAVTAAVRSHPPPLSPTGGTPSGNDYRACTAGETGA